MKTVGKKKKRQLLLKALDGDLDRISKSPWVRSLKDGKQYICTCCDLPVQPCKTNSSILCSHVLLEGTDGAILEKALKEFDPDTVGKCSICGNDIPLSYLRKHPTAEVCTKCQSKTRKVHSVH
jgi:hypothetical protein